MQGFGKYEVTRQIGEGGFGRVFEGFDPAIRRRVAIKTCNSAIPEVRSRFLREASIAGNLQHRNITVVFDLGEQGDTPYLVQEYLSGNDLSELLEGDEPLPLPTKLSYLTQLARGLGYAHSQGVVHRDIKPSNLRILEEGVVKIMDFGIAKSSRGDTSLTNTGETVGTSTYLSPEQVRADPLDARCDIYAFGVLAFELLTGRPLYRPGPPQKVIYAILNDPVPEVEEFGDQLPPRLAAIVRRCLQKDPQLRFANCGELLMELNQVALPSTSISASVTGPTVEYRDLPPGVREGYPPETGRMPDPAADRSELETDPVPAPPISAPAKAPADFDTADVDLDDHSSAFRPLDTSGAPRLAGSSSHRGRRLLITSLLLIGGLAGALFVAWKTLPGVLDGVAAKERSAAQLPSASDAGSVTEAAPVAAEATSTDPGTPVTTAGSGESEGSEDSEGSEEATTGSVLRLLPGWDPRISVSVDGANALTLDGEQLLELEPGRHYLEFSILRDDYQAFESLEVDLVADQRLAIEPPLPVPGRLTVRPTSRSVQLFVRIDGRPLGFTPLQERLLSPGRYVVGLSASGDSEPQRTIEVEIDSERETVLEATLESGAELLLFQRP